MIRSGRIRSVDLHLVLVVSHLFRTTTLPNLNIPYVSSPDLPSTGKPEP
jgi:hypothetical protein